MEWVGTLAGIIMINILLSGDNALIIALASRHLPEGQKHAVSLWGSFGAIGLRILLTFAAVFLLAIPYLELAGGFFLICIAVKILAQEKDQARTIAGQTTVWGAVKTIITADLVMSIDNVIAITGAARGNMLLLVIGLMISIPIIIWGSKTIGRLLTRWPVILVLGAAFLGWTAGEMIINDPKVAVFLSAYHWAERGIPLAIAVFVVFAGEWVRYNRNLIHH